MKLIISNIKNGKWNQEKLPHRGRHCNKYHEWMLEQLARIDKKANGDVKKFLKLFEAIKQKIRDNLEMLYKKYWNGK